ncbi:MAG: DUF429 domain-containing protein [Aquificaceae bacterium]|nr:DUF429 domain-containing protein [Aquificaceae bacterium]
MYFESTWIKEIKPQEVIGIDLSASELGKTGFAFLDGEVELGIVRKDDEILELCKGFKLILIDAPLSLPIGNSGLRECDRMLNKLGIRFFPINFGGMKKLTQRGIFIKNILETQGKLVFEVYPGALYDNFKIPRKDKKAIAEFFSSRGLRLKREAKFQDELDAVACFYIGIRLLEGSANILEGRDGVLIF